MNIPQTLHKMTESPPKDETLPELEISVPVVIYFDDRRLPEIGWRDLEDGEWSVCGISDPIGWLPVPLYTLP